MFKSSLFLLIPMMFFLSGMKQSSPLKGAEAPDFELKSPKGKTVKLSKMRGKMVLIDFWASWCRPCRGENPNVVQAYEKYNKRKFKNGKGFEILSVSLDRDESKWIQAIEADGLVWKNHGWDQDGAVSKLYGVSSIPKAFLIDGDGKIVASGNEVRGMNLHLTLDDQLDN
ncbi:MAG: TlpA family protein disulfide reductase [Fluviicola sp. XM-24bin1]|nr:MAG: TlpA family protein disulfide reductase [Fluviicola sp. XM-24bin1]